MPGKTDVPKLVHLGSLVRTARENAGKTRREVSEATGLNPQTIFRIETGRRRTRRRTLVVIASALSEHPDSLMDELVRVAGDSLAPESPWVERIERRRLRRIRRIAVLSERERYRVEREELEAAWASRTAHHLEFRGWMQLFDRAFRALQELGEIPGAPPRRTRRRWPSAPRWR